MANTLLDGTIHGAATPAEGWPATFLVVCWRMEGTVLDALAGALAQTVPCQVIVSDDSSGDATLERVRAQLDGYSGPHQVIVRSTPNNLGLCAHLQQLVELTSSPIVFNSAGDDVSKPQRVAQTLAEFNAYPQAQVVGSHTDDINAQGELIAAGVRGLPRLTDQRWLIRRGKLTTILGATMAWRRELFTTLPPLAGRVEDNMLMLRAALLGECRCLPEALVRYRRHSNNLGDWVFDRSETGHAGWARRQQRVAEMYLEIARDQLRCIAARPDLPPERVTIGRQLSELYRLEAQQRLVMAERPRREWMSPLWRGLRTEGLRRRSAERLVKLLLPRRAFGR